MNRLEQSYAEHLKLREHAGEVLWWAYEGMKFRLASNTFFTPDFTVMLADGTIEVHETKGFWEDDARIKIKVAAALYPFRFVGVKFVAKAWEFEDFSA